MRLSRKKQLCQRTVVFIAVFLAFFTGMKVNSFLLKKTAKPVEVVDLHKYASNFNQISKYLSENTLELSELSDLISNAWIKAIALGEDSDRQITAVFDELEKSGQKVKLEETNEKIEQGMKELRKNCPFKYKEAYKVLEDTYTQYADFYKSALNPAGSLVLFNKKLKEAEVELARSFSRLSLYNPGNEERDELARSQTVNQVDGKTEVASAAPPEEQPKGEQKIMDGMFGKNLEEVEKTLGSPLNEIRSDTAGSLQRQYSSSGKKVTIFYKDNMVTGWSK